VRITASTPVTAEVQVYVTPSEGVTEKGCREGLIGELNKAQHVILFQTYEFTDAEIARALVQAHKRGVTVVILMDEYMETNPRCLAPFLLAHGVPVLTDAEHSQAHNKVAVIDFDVSITGSYNHTPTAAKWNAENLIVLRSPSVAATYRKNFQVHLSHARDYVPGGLPEG
jgi:phosphatidylserine/phosphatidylglycerophosphate/cardiolipin synthase-like enzyme